MKCKLCEAIKNEKPIMEYGNYVILPTKNMKGHHKRIMIISKKHVKEVKNETIALDLFKLFCVHYFDEEPTFALVEPTYATIKNHWHRIACDWFGEEDIKQLHYTPHIAIKTLFDWSPFNYDCKSCVTSFKENDVKMGYCPYCGRDSLEVNLI